MNKTQASISLCVSQGATSSVWGVGMEGSKTLPLSNGTFWVEAGTSFLLQAQLSSPPWAWYLMQVLLGKQRVGVSHPSPEKGRGPCPKLPNPGLPFPRRGETRQGAGLVQLWLSASPRAHGLSQPGAKQCHESGPVGRLILGHGSTSGQGRGRSDRSKVTNREGQLPSLIDPSS